jgi:hypothetical protein
MTREEYEELESVPEFIARDRVRQEREKQLRGRLESLLAHWGVEDSPTLAGVIVSDLDIQSGLAALALIEVFHRKIEETERCRR